MLPVEVMPGIYWVGVNDRITKLFEGIWTIQKEGISYNSYIIKGQKSALIDLSKNIQTDELIAKISQIIEIKALDYIILNHVEPDHAGALNAVRQMAPNAVLVGTKTTQKLLKAFYEIDAQIHIVSDGDELSLGDQTLKFISMPFVHWPESMMTYIPEKQLLFSNDAFGRYGALEGSIYSDYYEYETLRKEALRYYVNIISHYEKPVSKLLSKMADVPLCIVAPSHGSIWRKDVQVLMDWYREWSKCASGKAKQGITMIYGSMYQNTQKMMEAIAQGVASENVPLNVFDVAETNVSYILPSLLERLGVMVGSPTYEGEIFPPVADVLRFSIEKKIFNRKAAFFGSYGWGGGARDGFLFLIKPVEWDLLDSLEFNGAPTVNDLEKGKLFGAQFARTIKTSAQ